jgi:hypothetical protein
VKTYRGAGGDDRTATARLELTSEGFHATVTRAAGTVTIEPLASADSSTYVVYHTADLRRRNPFPR